jgi:hypothetical protein
MMARLAPFVVMSVCIAARVSALVIVFLTTVWPS